MKPKRIILVRHGESEGNADTGVYSNIPDHKLKLTEKGISQAIDAGEELKSLIGEEEARFYVSPFKRTRETAENLLKAFKGKNIVVYEEPRLREQERGHLRDMDVMEKQRESHLNYSRFYYRFPEGESAADVYDRISTFLESLYRDFEKDYFPENAVIVTHGVTIKLFLMRWFHWTVEKFESMYGPENCQYIIMELNDGNNRYDITTGTYDLESCFKNLK